MNPLGPASITSGSPERCCDRRTPRPKSALMHTSRLKTPPAPRANWVPGPDNDFTDPLRPLIESIIKAGSKKSGIQVPRGIDGCPFPGAQEDMPAGWSWWMCWVFVGRRSIRLWLWCNARWVCVVCTETLYLTWLYSFVNGMRGVTNVTWNIRDRHIRGVVFAHERHGEQMVGYFPDNSNSLDDLRPSEMRNLRPETKFDNYAVHDWDKRDRDATANIRSQLDRVVISNELFDPARKPPKLQTMTSEETKQVDYDDLPFAPGMGVDARMDGEPSEDENKDKKVGTKAATKVGKKTSKSDSVELSI